MIHAPATLVLPEVRELIEFGDFATLGDVVNEWPIADLADLISQLSADDQDEILRVLRAATASDAFEYLDPTVQRRLLGWVT